MTSNHRTRWLIALLIAFFSPCYGREIFYLKSGFQLEARSHLQKDQSLLLQTASGSLELPANQVLRIETVADLALVPAQPQIPAPEDAVREAAADMAIDPMFVQIVAKTESRLNPSAMSPKGALGLMQLMPDTAAQLGVNPAKPLENAEGGAKYLRELLIRYHNDAAMALAAYNAGPGAVARYGGIPPYPETRRYIALILNEYVKEKRSQTHSQISHVH